MKFASMITALALASGLSLGSIVALGAQDKKSAPNVAGTWSLTVKGPAAHGDLAAGLVLKQDGKKVTGTFSAHGNEHSVEGEFADGTLELATVTADASHRITFTARLKDDGTLNGYLSSPMGDMTWTASRAKDK